MIARARVEGNPYPLFYALKELHTVAAGYQAGFLTVVTEAALGFH